MPFLSPCSQFDNRSLSSGVSGNSFSHLKVLLSFSHGILPSDWESPGVTSDLEALVAERWDFEGDDAEKNYGLSQRS